MKKTGLLNRKHVRDYILKRTQETRPGWDCTRVSPKAMTQLELMFTKSLNRAIHSHPTLGKTFKEVL